MTKTCNFDLYSRKTPKVSIIVPVYNAEKYLHRCIDSILNQTLGDFELLLINDGSKDYSGVVCDKYALKDSRVRVFHKENGGVSSARNLGLDEAKGEWITFVDSDDYVSSTFCEILHQNQSADFIVASFETFGKSAEKQILKESSCSKGQLFFLIDEYLSNPHFSTPWGKFFKKEVIDANKLRFIINIDSTEDTLFTYEYMLYADSLKTKSDVIYYYQQTSEGLSQHLLSVEKAIFTINSVVRVIHSLEIEYNITLSNHLYNIVDYIYLRAIRYIKSHYTSILQRRRLIIQMHDNLPLLFLKEYQPSLIGLRGKLFYFLARKQKYFLLSIYTYFVSI